MLFLVSILVLFSAPYVYSHTEVSERVGGLTQAIAKDPNNAQLFLKRAELLRQEGHLQSAFKDCVRAVKLDPSSGEAHLCKGNVLLEMNRPQAAKEAFDAYLRYFPGNAATRAKRARCLVLLKQYREAIQDFTAALQFSPSPDIYLERARAILAENPAQKEKALRSIQEGIEKIGSVIALELFALDLELSMEWNDAALFRIDRMLTMPGRKDSWFEQKGQILQKIGRQPEACEAFRLAWKSLDDLPPSRKSNRSTLALQRKLEKANRHCDLEVN